MKLVPDIFRRSSAEWKRGTVTAGGFAMLVASICGAAGFILPVWSAFPLYILGLILIFKLEDYEQSKQANNDNESVQGQS